MDHYYFRKFSNAIGLCVLLSLILINTSYAGDTLSYSGRLVLSNGAPVTGPVNLKVELAYLNTAVLSTDSTYIYSTPCSLDLTGVTLNNGVFNLNVDFSSNGSCIIENVLVNVPTVPVPHKAGLRVTDITVPTAPIVYPFQIIHSMPYATVASQLLSLGANNNQFLKWDGTKWAPADNTITATLPLSITGGGLVSMPPASTSVNGYLTSADWNTFSGKQGNITAGLSSEYYRGDKTWQTLDTTAVTEGTNLYYTNARVLGATLNLFANGAATPIIATDNVLQAFGKTQGQIDALTTSGLTYVLKAGGSTISGTTTLTGVLNVSTITGLISIIDLPINATDATNKGYVDLKVSKAGDTMSGVLTLDNDLKIKGGANYVTIKGHSASTAYNFVLPQDAGTANYVLKTDGLGNLSWINPSTVAAGTGTVNSASIVDDTIMDADINSSAAIAQSKIANLVSDLAAKQSTTLAPTQILVGDATSKAAAVAMSGDATLISDGTLTLKNTGTAGTYTSVTTDAQGRVTTGSNPTTFSGYGIVETSSGLANVISDETGTGLLVFGTSPTMNNPVIANIAPTANFTLTQNAVIPFTSEGASAVANTLYLQAGSVGIGTSAPVSTAVLDINSTTKGLLIPRMTSAQRGAIASPATGLQVYDTTSNFIYYYDGGNWQSLGVAGVGVTSLGGLSGVAQTFASGVAGTAPAINSSGTIHTLNIPMASTATVTAGLLSKVDYDLFNAKQAAFTTSASVEAAISDETGTGLLVFNSSPTFIGVPLAPTAAISTNTTQIATTSFVLQQAATVAPLINGAAAVGTSLLYARQDHVHPVDTSRQAAFTDSAGLEALISDETGTGLLVFGTSPTLSSPVISNINPGANFTLTNNGVSAFTSENASAVVNTLYLKAGSVGIGTNAPGASAILDISSTTKGLLIPRMTSVQRLAIASPVNGLEVYDTTANTFYFYYNGAWSGISSGSTTATGTTTGTIPLVGTGAIVANQLCSSDSSGGGISCNSITSSIMTGTLSDETGTGFAVFSASPTFTGIPLATTAAISTNTTQIATTSFVLQQAATVAPVMNDTAAIGTSLLFARQDHVHASDTSRQALLTNSADLAAALSDESGTGFAAFTNSPTFTGALTVNGATALTGTTTINNTGTASTTIGNTTGATAISGMTNASGTFKIISKTTSSGCSTTSYFCVDCGAGYFAFSAGVDCDTPANTTNAAIAFSGATSSLTAASSSAGTSLSTGFARYWVATCRSAAVPSQLVVTCIKQ